MKDKIKELRLRIDGISQLVKDLKPFTWIHGINKEAENTDADIYQMYLVSDSLSFSNTNHKYHTVIKTDRGTYRTSSKSPFDESLFKTFDRNSKEINKAYDSLILAKAWLGEILKELGNEPDTDKIKALLGVENGKSYRDFTHIEKLNWLKEEIDKLFKKEFKQITLEIGIGNNRIDLYCNNVYTYLCEARMWLQFELERTKENK